MYKAYGVSVKDGERYVDVFAPLVITHGFYIGKLHLSLPFAIGNDLADGLTKLEDRLSALPQSELSRVSQWSNAVDTALEHLKEVTNSSSDYGSIEGKFNTLSNDFSKIWE